ncbi:MAG: ribonuclease III [Candidatus Yanofskybacteria bacterium RIFCSPHIGHO2_01_FULL_41_27]|uniref:Ribonuclease 3 n=3 Tax=Parcubacteria group TaxID=1794811 RepID=A0A0G1ISN0_9BACT|nr:MAG: Ribonuclease 3 [Candidatus Giovannonibacteria bacterium GW2011_GWA2_44_26]KKU16382.1 MAG: Ribonuclease 3 [Candidatus Giovannonibacteria bacterium GW2011_GWB1_45_9b]OGM98841.1 MAG: ribonuclease III [Candidatus Yanofskybacteria bacterium RIFCSPHIGHO2_01_FULL_41_27]OGN10199.1 MAG: ribonuclease III [Candidatus Yanofskybacteria bacterium RIFCSPHIGHO2_02_FULL_41_12]OGN21415.1 MAG: ribonuclease III [Candidatus Yanofskybacteria bacterium RIFCSPLOWO2_01_FULL_41_33]
MSNENLSSLEKNIGYDFKNKDLLLQALTHRSYLNENPKWRLDQNERLEFLGDAVLELVVTEYLYKNFPNPEGEMTNWRAALVNAIMLSQITKEFDLNDFMLLSRGEAKDTGRARQYILANAIEALIGAIYLDGGYEPAAKFIEKFVLKELPRIIEGRLYRDAKSLFQEQAQDKVGITPSYEVLEEWGPDHARNFKIGVFLEKEMAGVGQGPSKQEAQQMAAEDALKKRGW